MEKTIKIFKSFEEQEQSQLMAMAKLSPTDRLKNLFEMQKSTQLFNPIDVNMPRKIIIKNGFTSS